MQFNPDPNKMAKEIIFSRKSKVHSYLPLTFNNNDVKKCPHQKHLGIILGLHTLIERRWRSKLTFFYKIVNGYLYLYLKLPSQE